MKRLAFLLPLLAACSFYPSSPAELQSSLNNYNFTLEEMSKRYPYWNVGVENFFVTDQNLNPGILPTPQQLAEQRLMTVRDKALMLQKLDIIRFVINTPEFETNFLKPVFWATRTVSGPGGSMELNKPLDNRRYLEIIRNRNYNVSIGKQLLCVRVAAVAALGPPVYTYTNNDPRSQKTTWVAFPNRHVMSMGGYAHEPFSGDPSYIAGILFHEMLHNLGFGHINQNDPVYGAQGVWTQTYKGKGFLKKYEKQLRSFMGYYQKSYPQFLTGNTVPVTSRSSYAALGPQPLGAPGETVCILYEDGTYDMQDF